ncbi:MAG: PAS domain-containing sensor histidine kinase [Ignavibacteriaceae bacterium]|nr:PAS domain-containing sensor histidine kinase [Ignavibacteriaceae bacterium]
MNTTNKKDTDPDILQSKVDIILELEEDLIFILNRGGLITKVNSNGLQMLEFKEVDILNHHIVDLIATKHKEEAMKAFNDLIEGKPELTFEVSFYSYRGKEILFDINAKPVYQNGKMSEIILVGKNITHLREITDEIENLKIKLIEANRLISIERQRANQRKSLLDELNKMKSEFVSNISHELRTPLASIIGFSETIDSDPDMPDEMKSEFNSTILNEGKRLARLINDILDISKLEGGKIEIVKLKFDAIEMLNEVIQAHIKSAQAKNIAVTSDFPEEEIIIEGDKERIIQTMGRLLNNAIKFTNEKGRIKIIAKNLFNEIEIVISDTGIGIPEIDLPYIFQKFYRVNRPGTEIAGTGLGLVFVKQIVDLHKGFIRVQSEAGKGTTFAIKLPKKNL